VQAGKSAVVVTLTVDFQVNELAAEVAFASTYCFVAASSGLTGSADKVKTPDKVMPAAKTVPVKVGLLEKTAFTVPVDKVQAGIAETVPVPV